MFGRKKKKEIILTPKGRFALYMMDKGVVPITKDGNYQMGAVLSAWADGKEAFVKAVCKNEELRTLLPKTISSGGAVEQTDMTHILRALGAAFGESFESAFTKTGSVQ